MIRRAEWKPVRLRPETPHERRLRRRDELVFTFRRRLLQTLLILPMVAFFSVGLSVGWFAGFFPMIAVFIVTAVLVSKLPDLDKQPLGAFTDLLPLPLPEGTFPVSIALSRYGVSTGKDEGAAAFAAGWLVVEGRRTSFSFRVGDARSENLSSGLRTVFPDGQSLVLWPLSVRDLAPDAGAFYHAVRRWLREDLKPEGEPILPPFAQRRR